MSTVFVLSLESDHVTPAEIQKIFATAESAKAYAEKQSRARYEATRALYIAAHGDKVCGCSGPWSRMYPPIGHMRSCIHPLDYPDFDGPQWGGFETDGLAVYYDQEWDIQEWQVDQ